MENWKATTEEVYEKELDLSEEEIEEYGDCTSRTQMCLSDCPWPFPGSYLNGAE